MPLAEFLGADPAGRGPCHEASITPRLALPGSAANSAVEQRFRDDILSSFLASPATVMRDAHAPAELPFFWIWLVLAQDFLEQDAQAISSR